MINTGMAILVMVVAAEGGLSLSKKEAVFEHDMRARFLLDGQALCKLKLPTPARDFIDYNMPDNAYMTGIRLGTLSMKYAVTGAPEDRAAVSEAIRALHLLCTVSGVPGLLARAVWPKERPLADDGIWRDSACGRYRWRGDVSSDQVDGVMFGFSLAHALAADEAEKALIAADAAALVDHILGNNLRIVDADGKPTRWGNYTPAYVRRLERMNALLWLQALKVTHQVTGEDRFDALYRQYAVDEGYAELAVMARLLLNPTRRGAVNHSDDVLLFLAYENLLRLETDPALREHYLAGFRRMWAGSDKFPGVKPEANPIYAFLAAKYLDDDSGVAPAIDTLRWFPLDMKWNQDTIAAYAQQFGFTYDPAPQSPEPEKDQPIPVDRRAKSWSAWVMDPYAPGEDRSIDAPIEYNGHDFLLGYWLGRHYGHIPTD